jgi:hypothetical protein
MPSNFGYEDGDVLYPMQDWLVKNTFLDIPEPPNVSLGSFFKDREVCSCPPRTAHCEGLVTSILEDVSEDEEHCPNESTEVESEDSGSRLDLRGCESPFSSQLLVCAEHPIVGHGSYGCADVCEPAWAWQATPPQPLQQMGEEITYVKLAESCRVASAGETLQQAYNASLAPAICLSEALQAPSLPYLPSMGSAGHHLGQCKPCAFTAKGCAAGESCAFCHLCDPSEHKRQKKEKRVLRRTAEWAEQVMRAADQEQELESGAVVAREFRRQVSRAGRRARG